MSREILSINRFSPVAEFIKDFDGFFNLGNLINWDAEIPSLKPHIIDTTGFPRANIRNISTTKEDKVEFMLAIPGWNKENSKLDITIENAILKIVGEKEEDEESIPTNKAEHYGKEYERNISLKRAFTWQHSVTEDTEFESASLKDGLLRVVVKVPLPQKPEPKRVTIE